MKKGIFSEEERLLVLTSNLPNKVIAEMLDRSVKSITKFKYRNTDAGKKCLAATQRRRRLKKYTYN